MKKYSKEWWKEWAKKAGVRAVKTAAAEPGGELERSPQRVGFGGCAQPADKLGDRIAGGEGLK